MNKTELAKRLGVSRQTVYKVLQRAGLHNDDLYKLDDKQIEDLKGFVNQRSVNSRPYKPDKNVNDSVHDIDYQKIIDEKSQTISKLLTMLDQEQKLHSSTQAKLKELEGEKLIAEKKPQKKHWWGF